MCVCVCVCMYVCQCVAIAAGPPRAPYQRELFTSLHNIPRWWWTTSRLSFCRVRSSTLSKTYILEDSFQLTHPLILFHCLQCLETNCITLDLRVHFEIAYILSLSICQGVVDLLHAPCSDMVAQELRKLIMKQQRIKRISTLLTRWRLFERVQDRAKEEIALDTAPPRVCIVFLISISWKWIHNGGSVSSMQLSSTLRCRSRLLTSIPWMSCCHRRIFIANCRLGKKTSIGRR